MSRFNIGIDTGGTYTDAVIVDLDKHLVAASAKAITTHGDLSIGVSNALGKVLEQMGDDFPRDEISLVSVSTTLATNALVEGQGAAVATILIGFDEAMAERTRILEAVPHAHIVSVAGGHDHTGEEISPLDVAAVTGAAEKLRGQVDAFAIASLYSVRNASHEHAAQAIVREYTDAPVTISSDLSDALDGPRRALTATLNARIVSRIVALIAAVRKSLASEMIDTRLMIVKGDGSLASADLVVDRPIETILSGPAASVIGARYLCQEREFIISDIGGTTTDIATAHDGWPDINVDGSMVGDYRTMVQAIDMKTVGLGGDSEIITDYNGDIRVANNRVVPISLIGADWPSVIQHMTGVILAGKGFRTGCRFLLRPQGYVSDSSPADLSADEHRFLEGITAEPVPWANFVHRRSDETRVAHLTSRGLIQVAGFTPSDAAHVLGKQSQWSVEAARLACQIAGRNCGRVSQKRSELEANMAAFSEAVVDKVVQKSTHLLLEKLSKRQFAPDNPLIAAVTSGDAVLGQVDVNLTSSIPVIAVGGPAPLYYPEVGKRLGGEAIIPPFSEVANAVGAAVGMIKVRTTIEITAIENGGYQLHAGDEPISIATPTEALKKAEEIATAHVEERARNMGATTTEVEVNTSRIDIPDTDGDNGLIAATITAECTGAL